MKREVQLLRHAHFWLIFLTWSIDKWSWVHEPAGNKVSLNVSSMDEGPYSPALEVGYSTFKSNTESFQFLGQIKALGTDETRRPGPLSRGAMPVLTSLCPCLRPACWLAARLHLFSPKMICARLASLSWSRNFPLGVVAPCNLFTSSQQLAEPQNFGNKANTNLH